jgi:hypothetical protein
LPCASTVPSRGLSRLLQAGRITIPDPRGNRRQSGEPLTCVVVSKKAIIADREFYDRAGPMNFNSCYRVHNYHFAAYSCPEFRRPEH